MVFTQEEIELTLNLYSIAQIHLCEINIHKVLNQNQMYEDIEKYYTYIINLVDTWLNSLLPDEKELILLRINEKNTFDFISIQLGYANHSSVVRKYHKIIKKLSELETVIYE